MKKTPKKSVVLYKVLSDGCSIHGGTLEWSLPTESGPGDWHEVQGPLVGCANGLHLTDDPSKRWGWGNGGDRECYLVETEGEVQHLPGWDDEHVARKVRLARRLTWAELADLGVTVDGPAMSKARGKRPAQPKVAAGPSPAMKFVRHAWENRCGATPHSWQTVNSTMRSALMLAITAGMSFAKDDIAEMYSGMRGGHWFGETGEDFYSAACEEGNLQACQSYEAWARRKPFMWEGKRLHVGRELMWEGIGVRVTSFQGDALTACSYKPSVSGYRSGKLDRRFAIPVDALGRAERDRKTEVTIGRDATLLHGMLSECNLKVAYDTLVAWTPEQREQAAEWARLAKHDAGKKRVRPAPPPEHLTDAVARAARDKRQSDIRNVQETLRRAEEEQKRNGDCIARCKAELVKLRAEEEREAA
jgi:hypothetical protein